MESFEIELIAGIIIGLLFLASIVAITVRRFRMPYTVALVLVGLGATIVLREYLPGFINPVNLRGLLVPQVILALLVPPLIFEAASHIRFNELGRNLRMILTFAIPGMILTMFLVGSVVYWGGAPLTWEMALVFGALIAATDPVAVVALFRTMGVPKRLQVLLEGESLFNDGTAILVFNLMIAIVLGTTKFQASTFLIDFIRIAGGGLLIGALTSQFISQIISRVDDHLIEITLTTVAAYGSYLIAESFHTSGVLAVVAAGLVTGNIGPRGMSPTTRIALFNFWEYAAFLANSLVFLTIGLVIDFSIVIDNWVFILLAIVAVLAARAVTTYLFGNIRSNVPTRFLHVIYWGGLRGAISLALALSLPLILEEGMAENSAAATSGLPEMAALIQAMSFGVVLFTLLVQGTTMRSLVKRLQLSQRTPAEEAYEQNQARTVAAQAAYERVKTMREEGLISAHAWEMIEPPMQRMITARTEAVREIMHIDRSVEIAELSYAYDEALRAQRSALNTLRSSGVITEDTFSYLVAEVDSALTNQEIGYGELLSVRSVGGPQVTHLICAVVKENEVQDAMRMLNILGIPTTRISSTLDAKHAQRTTLMMGVEKHQIDEVVGAILSCCTEPPEFTSPFANLIPGKTGKEMTIQGMLVYVIEVAHYEEF